MNVAVAAPDRGVPLLQARGVKKQVGGAQARRGVKNVKSEAMEARRCDSLDNQTTNYINMI